jgi:CubicO group peptidase (beta-lactamase class C family)
MFSVLNPARRFALVTLFCLVVTAQAFAQGAIATPASTPTAQQINSKADEYMNASVKVNRFTGTILVAHDGQPMISKGYGMANYELSVANTPQTVFRLGSITKQFTSMAIMMLQERGKLSVSDPICKYLEKCPAAWQPVTIRHLLTHTSGVPNYTDIPDFFEKVATAPYTSAGLVDIFRDKPLDFAPGEKYNYSNSGYHLLGLIIEKTSGASYARFLNDNIFRPLGMKSTGYDDSRALVPNRASGYTQTGDSFVNASYLNMAIPYSAGSLYSTTEDLLRWDQALYTEKLISRKSLDEMFTPFKETSPGSGYAYGWNIGKRFGRQLVGHAGGINGFNTTILRFPADHVTVIVLCNSDNGRAGAVANSLSAIVFGAPYTVPVERKVITLPAATLDKYVGQYELGPNFIMTITNEHGSLMAQATGQGKTELFAESEDTFFPKLVEATFIFVKDAQGQVTGFVLRQNGRDNPAKKIK